MYNQVSTFFFSKKNRDLFQLFLFLFINSLFVVKYSIRGGLNPYISVSTYCLLATISWLFISKSKILINSKAKTIYIFTTSLICIGIILLHFIINPYNLQVDRWSAIHNFLQNLFNGVYPYSAHTHLGGYGSPFPVWQAFHIPFYLLGNVGLGMLFSVILLSIFLAWFFVNDYRKAYIFFILLLISPAFWYEVAVRSDLIYNFILCFIAIGFIYKKKYSIQQQALGLGILCGLFLSTRFSIVIPFAIYLFPDFVRAGIKQKIIFGGIAIMVFVISFLPFVFWSNNTLFFFKYNPFILQTRQGSLLEVLTISILGIYLSTKWKGNISSCFGYISICILSLVTITFTHRMISDHFVNGLFDSAYDITYFNMALPFVIYVLAENNLKTHIKTTGIGGISK